MKALRLLPPLAWTAVVASFSADAWSAEGTGFLLPFLAAALPRADPDQIEAVLWLIRKAAHLSEYAILAALWAWALDRRIGHPMLGAWLIAAAIAALDEAHQATTANRTGSVADVALDAAGAAAALALMAWRGMAVDRVTSALLWTAAVGGTALIALNWAADAPSHWLWLSVPAAWIALAFWRRRPGRA